ncbi:O-antigen ligase family protein [Candidatus Omnitrophota bacterium]
MLLNSKIALVILLFSRALLDPVLNATKLSLMGEEIGVGGAVNLFVIILAILLIARNPKRFSQIGLRKNWMVFLFVCFFAVTYSPVRGTALRVFLNLVSYMSMVIAPFYLINTKKDKKFWVGVLLLSSVLPVCFANIDLLKGGQYVPDVGMRISGTFSHPNILSFYLVLVIVVVFYVLKSGLLNLSTFKKNLLRIYIINVLVLLVSAKTRNAWASCWVVFFTYGFLRERKYLLFSVVLPVALSASSAVRDRILDLFSHTSVGIGKDLNSFAWRLQLWKSSLPWIKNRFLLGNGLASFNPLSSSFFKIYFYNIENVPSHNSYLELLFETGIVGLLAYLSIFLRILKDCFLKMKDSVANVSKEYAIAISYVISYMLVTFADNMLYYLALNWYVWFFFGIILRGLQLEEVNNDIDNNPII